MSYNVSLKRIADEFQEYSSGVKNEIKSSAQINATFSASFNRCPNSEGFNYENKVYQVLWKVHIYIFLNKQTTSRIISSLKTKCSNA